MTLRLRLTAPAFILSSALVACGGAEPPPVTPPAPPPAAIAPPHPEQAFAPDDYEHVFTDADRRTKIASAFPAIDALVEAHVREKKVPSTVVGVVVDGELTHTAAFGVSNLETRAKVDADTVYRIGSITKSFTSLSILALRDEGAVSLDDPLSRFVAEAHAVVHPTRDAPPITIRQLLGHRSGLPRMGSYASLDHPTEGDLVKALSGVALESAPGTEWSYSNFGYSLLGVVVGRASPTSLRGFVGSRILTPLGMTSTVWDPAGLPPARIATPYHRRPDGTAEATPTPDLGATEGAGGLYSSVRDLARYAAFQLAAYPPRNEADDGPVRRSSVREAHMSAIKSAPMRVTMRDEAAPGENAVTARASAYGYAWAVAETCDLDNVVWHNGAIDGYTAALQTLPDRGVAVIALVNMHDDRSVSDIDRLSTDVLRLLEKTHGLSKRVRRMKKLPAAFDAVMPKFLAVLEGWSEEGYRAMLTKGRKVPSEKEEMAGYHATHGACKGYTPIEVSSPTQARFALQCERGTLEMSVKLSATDGLIAGFSGTSRDVPAPPKIAKVGGAIAGLVGKWSEPVYKKHLAPKASKPRAETATFFEKLRAAHGVCKIASFSSQANRPELLLACERGGGLTLSMELDVKEEEAVSRYTIKTAQAGACPVK